MANYIIFIPDTKSESETKAAMREAGLGDLLEGSQCQQITARGPNGGNGNLVHWSCPTHHERNCKLVVDEETIDWTESKPAGLFWMGQESDRPVSPEDIQRTGINGEVPHPGEPVQLGDMQEWIVPIARELPKRPQLNSETGEPELVVVERHSAFYDQAESYLQELMGAAEGEMLTFTDSWRFSCQALAMNYRVSEAIVDWLGVFQTENDAFNVCVATIELHQIIEAQKKTLVN